MQLLIDGYNLLHVTGVFVDFVGAGSVQRLHAALLDRLAALLGPDQCTRTTIVFDARGRRATARRTMHYAGITVHYAARDEDADTLIAELVRQNHSPRRLTVVSSDHQVQRAARRRRAKAVDSSVWYAKLLNRRSDKQQLPKSAREEKPAAPISEQDVNWWLRQFDEQLLCDRETPLNQTQAGDVTSNAGSESSISSTGPNHQDELKSGTEIRGDDLSLASPFPPEYVAEAEREVERCESTEEPVPKKKQRKPPES